MLPSGYKRLEYIQSSGTQYIDTGYKADQNRRVVMNVQPLVQIKNAWLFEGRNTSTQARSGIFFYYSSTKLWTSDWPSGRQNFSEIAETDRLLIDANKTICTVNEHSLTHTEKTFQSDYTLTLLACNTGGRSPGMQMPSFIPAKSMITALSFETLSHVKPLPGKLACGIMSTVYFMAILALGPL